MSHWVFIRHGESIANRDGWLSGHRDAPLTARGRAQAVRAADELKAFDFARAYSSDLQRAKGTAELVLAGRNVPLETTAALRERACGRFEGCTYREADAAGALLALQPFDGCPEGGESLRHVAIRAMEYLGSIDEDASKTILIAAHGALIRAVIGIVDGVSHDKISDWKPSNCEWVERTIAKAGWAALHQTLLA